MGFRDPAGMVHGLAATVLEFLQIIGDGVRDRLGAGSCVMALLVPQFGAPPCPCCLLCLPVIEHGDPVSVLQIVRGGNPVLGIATVGQSPPRKPSATLAAAPVAEREPLFEAP